MKYPKKQTEILKKPVQRAKIKIKNKKIIIAIHLQNKKGATIVEKKLKTKTFRKIAKRLQA